MEVQRGAFMVKWQEQRPAEDFYRVLNPDGTLTSDSPQLEEDELLRMYRAFIQTRVFENKILSMQRRGEISIIARSLGEEATPLGSLAALEPGDWCFPSYRQAAGFFYWNFPPELAMSFFMDFEPETIEKYLDIKNESPINFSPVYVPLATNIPNGVGSAMFDNLNNTDKVNLAYIGDGSTSEGGFYEGMNFAGVFDAPFVAICQNNQWAISVPSHRQTAAETFAQKSEAFGIPHERVDGNDVLAVYKKTKDAVQKARKGGGPTFIECVTYRMAEHNTADDEKVYRNEEEKEFWENRDPVDRFEIYLRELDLLDDNHINEIKAEMEERIQEAVDVVRSMPSSNPEMMFENHFINDSSWARRHQREELQAERAGQNPFTDFTGEGL